MLRRTIAFVVAASVLVVFGSFMQSYLVQQAWSIAAGQADGGPPAALALSDRIAWAGHDFAGIFLRYGGLTAGTLLVTLLAAGAIARFTGRRVIVFGITSALGIFTMFTVVRIVLGTVGIFGVRGMTGLAAQMLIALGAGMLFALLTRSRAG
jgi:hypothetical protein